MLSHVKDMSLKSIIYNSVMKYTIHNDITVQYTIH